MNILFPCLFQKLYDVTGVVVLPGVDHVVNMTRITDMELIHDDTNMVYKRKEQPSISLGEAIFEGPLDSTK